MLRVVLDTLRLSHFQERARRENERKRQRPRPRCTFTNRTGSMGATILSRILA
jgi:hypothetical protein